MMNVTGRRPFSELGDQQLLEQTRRLAANQRCLEVHILDHLDEIDRRGLALRRGFSSLFDYAVRELRFSDAAGAAAHPGDAAVPAPWVGAGQPAERRAESDLGSAVGNHLCSTHRSRPRAGAERAERQCRTGRRNVGQGRCHDQDHDSAGRTRQLGPPAAPSEAGEQGERGPRSAPGLAPRAEQCASDAAAVNTPVVPVASHAVGQDPGAGPAGALLPRPELNGNASPFPAPSCRPLFSRYSVIPFPFPLPDPPRRPRTKALLHSFYRRRISGVGVGARGRARAGCGSIGVAAHRCR